MLIRDLVKFANTLDGKGLKKEADAVDAVISAIKTLLEERGGLDGDMGGTKEQSREPDGDSDGGGEKQVELFEYDTKNFEICPGAVTAFEKIKMKLGSDPGDMEREHALTAIEKTDDLFEIEKNAISSESVTSKEVGYASDLYEEIIYNIGMLSAEAEESFLGDFKFLAGHIDTIKGFRENKETKDESEE